jgi:hypothetical protein
VTRKDEIRKQIDYPSDAHTRLKHAFYRRYIGCDRERWSGLVEYSARGWTILAVVAIVIVIATVLAIEKPWESQNYKDCVKYGQSAVNGSPQGSLEAYCKEAVGN